MRPQPFLFLATVITLVMEKRGEGCTHDPHTQPIFFYSATPPCQEKSPQISLLHPGPIARVAVSSFGVKLRAGRRRVWRRDRRPPDATPDGRADG